jgi:hypothetical protein
MLAPVPRLGFIETKLKAAPYCAEIESAVKAGKACNVRLFAGNNAWERAKQHRNRFGPASALVLPPGSNPLFLRWPRITDVVADITGIDGTVVRDLGAALIRDGAMLVYAIDAADPERTVRFVRKRGAK